MSSPPFARRASKRLPDRVEQAVIRRDDVAGIHHVAPAAHLSHKSPGFSDQHDPGRQIPRTKPLFPEPVEPARPRDAACPIRDWGTNT